MPQLTIIVATYNRSRALRNALRAALAQSFDDWQMLVIGDACTDDSAEVVSGFADRRIAYIDLPQRFGEQAGPNSVGMALAETDLIAFLNHDDLWLPDHLARAVSVLDACDVDVYWARAAFFGNRGPRTDRAMFVGIHPSARTLDKAYRSLGAYCEPLSSWVLRQSVVDEIGPMRLASALSRPPIEEFVFRMLDHGVRLTAADEVTVLKDRVLDVSVDETDRELLYSIHPDTVDHWTTLIERGEIGELEELIGEDLWLADQLDMMLDFEHPDGRIASGDAQIRHVTGIDVASQRVRARSEPGDLPWLLRGPIHQRTGSGVATQPQLDAAIAAARTQLEARGRA